MGSTHRAQWKFVSLHLTLSIIACNTQACLHALLQPTVTALLANVNTIGHICLGFTNGVSTTTITNLLTSHPSLSPNNRPSVPLRPCSVLLHFPPSPFSLWSQAHCQKRGVFQDKGEGAWSRMLRGGGRRVLSPLTTHWFLFAPPFFLPRQPHAHLAVPKVVSLGACPSAGPSFTLTIPLYTLSLPGLQDVLASRSTSLRSNCNYFHVQSPSLLYTVYW
jgi:hypothetical protein